MSRNKILKLQRAYQKYINTCGEKHVPLQPQGEKPALVGYTVPDVVTKVYDTVQIVVNNCSAK